jgi:hypothetical protein
LKELKGGKGEMKKGLMLVTSCFAAVLIAAPLWAAEEESAGELARKAQNPVADMMSFPFQDNMNFGYGPNDGMQNVMNFQPVIPLRLNKDWNLITRTIAPLIYQPWPEYEFGLGDIQFTPFFSPAKSSKFIWGAGPVFQFPTATDEILGTGKWTVGPSGVGLLMEGPWVAGLLAQNVWSYAGDSDRKDVNAFLAQPFINYNFEKGWYLTFSPIITANWKADKGSDVWTVPLGLGFGKIFRIGKLPFNGNISAFYNVAKPEVGPDWTLRVQLALLLPTSMFKGKEEPK